MNLNNLAPLLQDTSRLKEAEPLIRRALEIMANAFGTDHPYTQTVEVNDHHLRDGIQPQ